MHNWRDVAAPALQLSPFLALATILRLPLVSRVWITDSVPFGALPAKKCVCVCVCVLVCVFACFVFDVHLCVCVCVCVCAYANVHL